MVVGLIVLGCLWVPAVLATTLVTPPPPTVGFQEWQDYQPTPPTGSKGPGARGLPVSDQHSLRAFSCPASTARVYPLETVCRTDRDSSIPRSASPESPSQIIRRKAFLIQRDRFQKIALWRCSKRTSSRSTHCGFQSWTSPEGFRDKIYEHTLVTPEECLQAVKQHLWTDPRGDIH